MPQASNRRTPLLPAQGIRKFLWRKPPRDAAAPSPCSQCSHRATVRPSGIISICRLGSLRVCPPRKERAETPSTISIANTALPSTAITYIWFRGDATVFLLSRTPRRSSMPSSAGRSCNSQPEQQLRLFFLNPDFSHRLRRNQQCRRFASCFSPCRFCCAPA